MNAYRWLITATVALSGRSSLEIATFQNTTSTVYAGTVLSGTGLSTRVLNSL
jgi:hypothetical protein